MADTVHTGREHIPTPPLWITIIRGLQFLFNIIVMGTAANAASYFYLDGYGMAFFTFVWTVLFLLYIFLAPRFMPHLYHFWVHVGLEVLTVIWWLITMALLAHYTRAWSGRSYGYWRSGIADSTRAATAFAVLNWLLFLVTLGAILFLSRSATIDGSRTHTTSTASPAGGSSFGTKVSSLFARKPRTADPEAAKTGADTELGGGPVHNNGAPTGTNDYGAPYGAGGGQTNTTNTGYGQHWAGPEGTPAAPPSAAAPHYGEPNRY